MRRTCLRNKFIDYKTDADRVAYNKHLNYCDSMKQKEIKPITVILKYLTQWKIKPLGKKKNLFFQKRQIYKQKFC